MVHLREFLATGFYTGYLKPAPGTFGSWAALCLYIIAVHISPLSAENTSFLLGILFLVMGLWVSEAEAKRLGLKDPPTIVIDEFSGMFLTFVASPFSYVNAICGFILFRIFDITKVYPIKKLQDLPGSWGIMLDDLAAALYSALILSFLWPFLEKFQELFIR